MAKRKRSKGVGNIDCRILRKKAPEDRLGDIQEDLYSQEWAKQLKEVRL